jgi:site-specific DNA-methyltransferase (adenine-specific)
MTDLRHGDWRSVLADVDTCDAVIMDPPYAGRVRDGYRSGSDPGGGFVRIAYECGKDDLWGTATYWMGRAAQWVIIWCSHQQYAVLEDAAQARGWLSFAPVAWLKLDAPPRITGDGPACSLEQLFVARPRRWPRRRGSRPGHYLVRRGKTEKPRIVIGQKPLDAVRSVVRHYTDPGDLIVDPFAGSGTTIIAAHLEGRRAIGAELDPTTHDAAMRRIEALTA